MDPKDLEFEETLADSELLLKNTARSMDEDAEFTLESILAEYGSGTPAAPEPEEKEPEPPAEKKPHIPGGLDETQRAICAALLAGEADFDALCAAGGMESDELGALLIEMEMDGLVTPLAGTRYAPGTQMTG